MTLARLNVVVTTTVNVFAEFCSSTTFKSTLLTWINSPRAITASIIDKMNRQLQTNVISGLNPVISPPMSSFLPNKATEAAVTAENASVHKSTVFIGYPAN